MKLSEDEKSVIGNALRIARDRYEEDASTMRRQAAQCDPGASRISWERAAAQFDTQVAECTALLNNQFEDYL